MYIDKVFRIIAKMVVAQERPLEDPKKMVKVLDLRRRMSPEERSESTKGWQIFRLFMSQYGAWLKSTGEWDLPRGGSTGMAVRQWLNSSRLGDYFKDQYGRVKPEMAEDIKALILEVGLDILRKTDEKIEEAMLSSAKGKEIIEQYGENGKRMVLDSKAEEILNEEEIIKLGNYLRNYSHANFINWIKDNIDNVAFSGKSWTKIEEQFKLYVENRDIISEAWRDKYGRPITRQELYEELCELPKAKEKGWKPQDFIEMWKIKRPKPINIDAPVGGEDEGASIGEMIKGKEQTAEEKLIERELQAQIDKAIDELYQRMKEEDPKNAPLIRAMLRSEFDLTGLDYERKRKKVTDAVRVKEYFQDELNKLGILENPEEVINTVEQICADYYEKNKIPVLKSRGDINPQVDWSDFISDPRWENLNLSEDKIDDLMRVIGRWFSIGTGYSDTFVGAPSWKNTKHHIVRKNRMRALQSLMRSPTFREIMPIARLQRIYRRYLENPKDAELESMIKKLDPDIWQLVLGIQSSTYQMLKQGSKYEDRFLEIVNEEYENYKKIGEDLYNQIFKRASDKELLSSIMEVMNG